MLTYQCRVVLRELKKLTNNTDANFCYLFCTHSFSLDNSEVNLKVKLTVSWIL